MSTTHVILKADPRLEGYVADGEADPFAWPGFSSEVLVTVVAPNKS